MKKLVAIWAFLDFCLLVAGLLSITMSVVLGMGGDLILDLFFMEFDQKLGIIIGGMYIFVVTLSIPAIMQPRDRDMLLKALTWLLLLLAIVTLVAGTIIWVFSLQQLQTFSEIWVKQDASVQGAIQDSFKCCGYWNGTTAGQYTTAQGFCLEATFAAAQPGCQSSITASISPGSDFILETLFSTVYGFEAIIVCFFVTTLCVINERRLEVRFARIDEKRGGGGFV